MKKIFLLIISVTFSVFTNGQEFLWAESYDISNCNEVAALATDISGNIVATGIHDAPFSLPFQGDAYIMKTDPDGAEIWTDYMEGTLVIGDMATVGSDIMIIGQATGPFTYRGVEYEDGPYFMFVMMLDGDGSPKWYFTDQNKWGMNTNIKVGNNGNIALHIRGSGNLGDWIMIVDPDGNVLNEKLVSATKTLVMDIAYFDNKIYFNGGFNGPGTIMVDTILIELPPVENASITMGFDEDLTAQWLYVDQTISNFVGRIVADESGIYVYEPTIESNFASEHSLKKFTFDGELVNEVDIPFYSALSTFRVDMDISDGKIGMFTRNSSDFNSHKVFVYDYDLNLNLEKGIDGPSQLYSGQISMDGEDIFVSHVHDGDLNFNDELTLIYSGTGNRPYISKIGDPTVTSINPIHTDLNELHAYPNPASGIVNISIPGEEKVTSSITVFNLKGSPVKNLELSGHSGTIGLEGIPSGFYFIRAITSDNKIYRSEIVVQ